MTEAEYTGPLRPGHVRLLKLAIVIMGVLILAGVVALIARIMYLAWPAPTQPSPVPAGPPSEALLALPPGALVRQIALSGERLAVHYESPSGAGIALLDARTGAIVARIVVVPEPSR